MFAHCKNNVVSLKDENRFRPILVSEDVYGRDLIIRKSNTSSNQYEVNKLVGTFQI